MYNLMSIFLSFALIYLISLFLAFASKLSYHGNKFQHFGSFKVEVLREIGIPLEIFNISLLTWLFYWTHFAQFFSFFPTLSTKIFRKLVYRTSIALFF